MDGEEYDYRIFVPHAYDSQQRWPLIFFLHGRGQSGRDGRIPAEEGLGQAIKRRGQSFPFLAVFPQSAERTWSAGSKDARRALAILDEVCRDYSVDEDRVYLTGFSMGGGGTWSLAKACPERWAALVPVCGFGNPDWGADLAHIPSWCFHGAADEVVRVERTREMVEAIKGAGGMIRYTEYPNVGHNSWDLTYETDELYEWLLQQRRPTP